MQLKLHLARGTRIVSQSESLCLVRCSEHVRVRKFCKQVDFARVRVKTHFYPGLGPSWLEAARCLFSETPSRLPATRGWRQNPLGLNGNERCSSAGGHDASAEHSLSSEDASFSAARARHRLFQDSPFFRPLLPVPLPIFSPRPLPAYYHAYVAFLVLSI